MDSPITERDWLYSISLLPGIGRKALHQIRMKVGSFDQVGREDWSDPAWPEAVKRGLAQLTLERVQQDKQQRIKAQINFITPFDPLFPSILKEIPDPPWLLFYRGQLELIAQPGIAVVGTRRPTPYGRSVCQALVKSLTEAGCTIISGLAYGIDAEAHRTALKTGGKTIAVLGCGIDQIYPAQHRSLYQQIADQGLIISEYPPGIKPHPGLFPERNRLISGLSAGVVVMEAAQRSGTFITVDHALEQGREVFAVPGPIFSLMSEGPHNLLKQGAKLVTSSADILEELDGFCQPVTRSLPKTVATTPGERRLLSILGYQPLHWDELYAQLDKAEQKLLDRDLVQLQIKGLIAALPGGYYVRQQG